MYVIAIFHLNPYKVTTIVSVTLIPQLLLQEKLRKQFLTSYSSFFRERFKSTTVNRRVN